MKLLLLSNSTLPGEPFLQWPRAHIKDFLGGAKKVAFVPFAAVTMDLDDYAHAVGKAFEEMGYELHSVHAQQDPVKTLDECDAIAVGGGNSFQLLRQLYSTGTIRAIKERVRKGTPYIGWSAGSNVACPTIMTTNDMPITEPPSLRAMHLVPFQINPHYTDQRIPGHGGEGRDQRLEEYLALHQNMTVAGLREGSLLRAEGRTVTLEGKDMRIFRHGAEPVEVLAGTVLKVDLAPL